MARIKQHMYQHLRSAKEWLTKAEEAFDREHDVRAELDLMLAQAELQRVKEVNRSRQWRFKYVLYRHGLACTLAMLMVVAVSGVYWWSNKPPLVSPVPLAVQVDVPVETVAKAEAHVVPIIISEKANPPVQQSNNQSTVPAVSSTTDEIPKPQPPRQLEKSRQPEQPVVLSADEMQKLVRAAGKSLRGQ